MYNKVFHLIIKAMRKGRQPVLVYTLYRAYKQTAGTGAKIVFLKLCVSCANRRKDGLKKLLYQIPHGAGKS